MKMPDKKIVARTTAPAATEPTWRQPPPKRRKRVSTRPLTVAPVRASTVPQVRLPTLRLLPRQWVMAATVCACLVGAAFVFTDYRFFVYDATITGNQRVMRDAIYAASQVDQSSIFWVRPDEVAERVRDVPGVESASVRARLPNEVRIHVKEYEPFVVWQSAVGSRWLAGDGTDVPVVGEPPAFVLNDPASALAIVDGTPPPGVMADLRVLRQGRPDLPEVFFSTENGLYFRAPEGWLVLLGAEGAIAERLALLDTAAEQISAQDAPPREIDLRVRGQIFIR